MTSQEYNGRLRDVIYAAGVNARYHQFMESRYDLADKCIRIAVAVFAIFGMVLAVPKFDALVPQISIPWIGFWLALFSLIVAGILNIVPVIEKAKFHGAMFRAWSELRAEAVLEQQKTCGSDPERHHIDRLSELISKMESLNADEPFEKPDLLRRFQEEENEMEWGKGIRTTADVEKERRRRQQEYASISSGGAGEAGAADQE